MNIIASSDFHGGLPEIPECDLLIIGGDVCPVFDHSMIFQRSWLELDFANWLKSVPAKQIVGIGGNHDFALEAHPDLARKLPWQYLLDEGFEYEGLKLWGIPWVPDLDDWAFHHMDHVLDEKYALIPEGTDIVIGHGPPMGYCDFTVPKYGSVHAGFPGANDMLERVKPWVMICGHIHEGYGTALHPSNAWIYNVSHMTENYAPINPPMGLHPAKHRTST